LTAATPNSPRSLSSRQSTADQPRRLARLIVSPAAVVDNWRFFARQGAAECAAVVKADAYGLGAAAIAPALASAGCKTFFVATLGEGLALRETLGEGAAIFVLNGVEAAEAALFRAARLIPVLNSSAQIAAWGAAGPCALHVDTGMNRLGLLPSELGAADHLAPVLVMSHLACAARRAHPLNERQRLGFLEAAARFPEARKSLSASAGALFGAPYAFDLIRPGIGLYGGGPFDEDNPPLAAAARLEAPLLQVRDLAAGDSVGYGATYVAPTQRRIATASIGYADGFLRSLSGKGYGVLNGARCPVLGRVSMDLVTLDVSAAPDAREGDWIELLGPSAPVDEVARLAGTIPYEILTGLSHVRRVIA
jgi:alanine racemase